MIRGPLSISATIGLGSAGLFLMGFSCLTSVTECSILDVVGGMGGGGTRSVFVDVFEKFCFRSKYSNTDKIHKIMYFC